MNVYINTSFKGHWPIGTSAIVVANDIVTAARYLKEELNERGLEQEVQLTDMKIVDLSNVGTVEILNDGTY